jgi:type I restriction enzyme S subunit
MSFSEAGYQGVEPGDFVFHGLDGFAGAVGVSEDRGKVSPVYHVCTATVLVSERFMAWALRALATNGFLEAYAFSVRQRSVDFRNWTTFAGLPITYIPIEEQVRIADELDETTARVEAMLAKVADLKSLLLERRAALITDVVTGKKEVA